MSISADGQTILATVSDGGVMQSTDGGKTWSAAPTVADRYSDITLTQDGVLVLADKRSQRQFDVLWLSGSYTAGDKITVTGLTPQALVYTVVAEDLTADGAKSTTRATDAQAATNIAVKLAKAINTATGSVATATANQQTLELMAKGSGTQVGWYDLQLQVQAKSQTASIMLQRREAVAGAPYLTRSAHVMTAPKLRIVS